MKSSSEWPDVFSPLRVPSLSECPLRRLPLPLSLETLTGPISSPSTWDAPSGRPMSHVHLGPPQPQYLAVHPRRALCCAGMVVLPGCHLAGASWVPVLLRSGQDPLPKESPLWVLVAAPPWRGLQSGPPTAGNHGGHWKRLSAYHVCTRTGTVLM